MFRDRLRLWRMNNKNRRSSAHQILGSLPSADNGDDISKPGSHYNKIGRNSSRFVMLGHENIHKVLQTPKEMLVLQRTLKGVLDWQQHVEDSEVVLGYSFGNTRTFIKWLRDMDQCLYVNSMNPFSSEKTTSQLGRISAELGSHIGVTCTPLAVLCSVNFLSNFAHKRAHSSWYNETLKFLINAAIEVFPDSHPSLLLLRLLSNRLTASQLVMMYKVGSDVMKQCGGEALSFSLRTAMHSVASRFGLGATIRSYGDALCVSISHATNTVDLHIIARLYGSLREYEKSADAVRRHLAQIEDKAGGDSPTSIAPLRFLAFVQYKQKDCAGEEATLQKILKITLARDRREVHTSQLTVDALDAISELDAFYVRHDLNEQRDILHLEHPSAFEV